MAWLEFITLFTLSHGGIQNQQRGMSLWLGLFHVAGQNFEEILQHLKKTNKKKH